MSQTTTTNSTGNPWYYGSTPVFYWMGESTVGKPQPLNFKEMYEAQLASCRDGFSPNKPKVVIPKPVYTV